MTKKNYWFLLLAVFAAGGAFAVDMSAGFGGKLPLISTLISIAVMKLCHTVQPAAFFSFF
ncbi:MAG: hypothetical protein LBB81_05165 [Treponema sp.]|jgi:hypothetical protein|nr:hypothetical protein [Treponema sp.]